VRTALLTVVPPPYAGADADTLLCADGPALNLFPLLGAGARAGGAWSPGNGTFNPGSDAAGLYTYVVDAFGGCPADTAVVSVEVQGALSVVYPDTTLCTGEILRVAVPPGLDAWQWSDGSTAPLLTIDEAGTYGLSGQSGPCSFSATFNVAYTNCSPCQWYAPNVFSPNDDGVNDRWQVFVPCVYTSFVLEVYDRWGNLLFRANDPEAAWDGRHALPGVYAWRMRLEGDLLGEKKVYEDRGDVTVVR
jgi:gliding motility-associated-like protein